MSFIILYLQFLGLNWWAKKVMKGSKCDGVALDVGFYGDITSIVDIPTSFGWVTMMHVYIAQALSSTLLVRNMCIRDTDSHSFG